MTTNVTITSNYIMKPRKLRIQQVDPKTGQVYRSIIAETPEVLGTETLVVHDGAKLIIEEIE